MRFAALPRLWVASWCWTDSPGVGNPVVRVAPVARRSGDGERVGPARSRDHTQASPVGIVMYAPTTSACPVSALVAGLPELDPYDGQR